MTNAIRQAKFWYWQRISAMVLAICVFIHIGVIIYAVRGGLTGAEILARTQGNWAVALFYGIFVLACTVHVPIGITKIAREWLALTESGAAGIGAIFGIAIFAMGLRAVYAVVIS